MPEIPVRIPVDDGKIMLEGLFQQGTVGRNSILCHPLPLYGGSMDNNVVVAARQAFAARGWGTLRFNFRGVGRSEGEPGQPEKEAEDLVAVARYLKSKDPGPLDLAGYSYGAWVALGALRMGLAVDSLCLFSPPLDFISFAGLELPDKPVLITLGNVDDFCKVESLRGWLAGQPSAARARVEILPYCDHFYWEFDRELSEKIKDFLRKNFPPGSMEENA